MISPSRFSQGHTLICTLEAGAAFGESILYDTPRNATVITSSAVMLLRVEQKDFKIIWEVNRTENSFDKKMNGCHI